MAATLEQFAQVNDAAAATTKKLRKQAILAEYFRTLAEADLRLAIRYAAGRAFAATDERTLNVGGAIVWDVTLAILGVDPVLWRETIVRSGDVGEAIARMWEGRRLQAETVMKDHTARNHLPGLHVVENESRDGVAPADRLTLGQVAEEFDALAATGVVERKRQILYGLLSRCRSGREAAYVAKIILGDLRTGVQEGVLAAAIARGFGQTLVRVQRCQLLMGDLEEVALLARRGALDEAQFRLFHPIQFMLATPQETAEIAAATLAGRTFWAEDKLDGIRAQVHKSGERVAIYTRTMDRTDESFPDVVAAISRVAGDFLLDGEIVPFRDGRVLPFSHIQKRLGRKRLTAGVLRENPAVFIAFDALYVDGELLIDRPLRDRREKLMRLLAGGGGTAVRGADPTKLDGGGEPLSPCAIGVASASVTGCSPQGIAARGAGPARPSAFGSATRVDAPIRATGVVEVASAEQIAAAFAGARGRRNEGIVLKGPDSIYSPGRRGQTWLKLKTHLPTFDCVVTAAEYGHGKRRNVLSDYTFAVWKGDPSQAGAELVNVGKAYSGLTDQEIGQLTEVFLGLSQGQVGRVHVVRPKIVLEIACDQIQKSDRHASGYALRFPRIKRIRMDKRPEDADQLARIIEIYESSPNFGRATGVREPTLFD